RSGNDESGSGDPGLDKSSRDRSAANRDPRRNRLRDRGTGRGAGDCRPADWGLKRPPAGTAGILACRSLARSAHRPRPSARAGNVPLAPVKHGLGESLKIGDVAQRLGVSASLVRAWERLGLAQPARTDSKYRIYTSEDFKALRRAVYLRRVRGLNAAAI